MLTLSVYFFVTSQLIVNALAYKILICNPQTGYSHVAFLGQIADILVEAGHEVVLYVPAFFDNVNVTGTKLARVIHRPLDHELPYTSEQIISDAWTSSGTGIGQVLKLMVGFLTNMKAQCDMQLKDEKLMASLRDEHFDLGISETTFMCGFAIFQKIGLQTHIAVFTTNLLDIFSFLYGVENKPSFVPGASTDLSDVMTYGERWKNMLSYATTTLGYELLASKYTNYEGAAPGFSIESVLPKSVFAFVNSEEFFEYPRPISHKTIFIGGIGVKKAKPLNEEYKEIMNNANGPVVLVSFGSVAKSAEMPLHIRNVFIETFTRLPEVTFIWKFETSVADDIVANLTNVITKKWVPQTDLLAHPKLRAFLTHAGQNSVTESIHAGVPMVCIPLYGDQQRNGKIAEKKNVAVVLDKRTLHADLLTEAIRNVLYNVTYAKSSALLARMIAKKPVSARDRLIKYTEFAAEFGPFDNLNSAGLNLNFIQYHSIDIILPALIAFIIIILTLVYIFKYFVRLLYRLRTTSKSKNE